MIFGNPDKFAIYIDIVEDWSNPSFLEGLFFYIIDAKFCPRIIPKESCTIDFYMSELSSVINKLETTSIKNENLFNLSYKKAHKELSELRFIPYDLYLKTGREEDYTYSITVGEMLSDIGEIFLVSNGEEEKILYRDPITNEIFTCILDKGYVLSIMKQSLNWWNNFSKK